MRKTLIVTAVLLAAGCSNQPHVQTGINAGLCGVAGGGIGLLATNSAKVAAGGALASSAVCGAATEAYEWYLDQQEENTTPHWHNGRHV